MLANPDFTYFKRASGAYLIVPQALHAHRWLLNDMGLVIGDSPIMDGARIAMEVKPENFPQVRQRLEGAGMVCQETGKA